MTRQSSARLRRLLADFEFTEVAQLACFSERDLRCLPNVGTVTVAEVRRRLRSKGMTLTSKPWGAPMPDAIRAVIRKRDKAKGYCS